MPEHVSDVMQGPTRLEQPAPSFMPQIVKAQVKRVVERLTGRSELAAPRFPLRPMPVRLQDGRLPRLPGKRGGLAELVAENEPLGSVRAAGRVAPRQVDGDAGDAVRALGA